MYPVPVTMQTLAVILMGLVLGPRAGTAIVIGWLSLAAMGAPVLAGGKTGLIAFTGPTAGYLLSFPATAFLAGFLPKANNVMAHLARLGGALGLHGLILLAGWAWLSRAIGADAALMAGVVPFLIGAVLKSGLAAALFAAWKNVGNTGQPT
jgi:biotin transport system substrate-specific component